MVITKHFTKFNLCHTRFKLSSSFHVWEVTKLKTNNYRVKLAIVVYDLLRVDLAGREVELRNLRAELVLDGSPLELHGGGEEAGLGRPQLRHQEHRARDFKLLQPLQSSVRIYDFNE